MINILIDFPDKYFRAGMISVINDFFINEFNETTNFTFERTKENILKSEIIIVSLCLGEQCLCSPFLETFNETIIIWVVNKKIDFHNKTSPCYKDMVFLSRQSSLVDIRSTIRQSWLNKKERPFFSCESCDGLTLSNQQIAILDCLRLEMSNSEVSKVLNVNLKTYYSKKYKLLKMLNINKNSELYAFLQYLKMR